LILLSGGLEFLVSTPGFLDGVLDFLHYTFDILNGILEFLAVVPYFLDIAVDFLDHAFDFYKPFSMHLIACTVIYRLF